MSSHIHSLTANCVRIGRLYHNLRLWYNEQGNKSEFGGVPPLAIRPNEPSMQKLSHAAECPIYRICCRGDQWSPLPVSDNPYNSHKSSRLLIEQTTGEAISGAGVEGPFILCPHSASGLEAIYWAQKYPEEIEGIAALDISMPGYHKDGFSTFEDYAVSFIANSGWIRLIPSDSLCRELSSSELTAEEKKLYSAHMYAHRGSKTMLREADACEKNVQTVSNGEVPTVPMLFFISKQMAAVLSPDNPEWYLSLARNYTNNKAEYIELDCGHYVHLEEPDFVASEIRRFAEKTNGE